MSPLLIAIAGPSGSGKSLLTRGLLNALSKSHSALNIAVVPEDAYYHSQAHLSLEQRAELNFDHPAALDHALLRADLTKLKNRQPADIPQYDYANHTRRSTAQPLAPADLIIVEGCLLLTQDELCAAMTLRVFVQANLETCLKRRIARDTVERGRTRESVEQQFETTVRPMYHAFLAPSAQHADLLIDGEADPEAAIAATLEKLLPLLS